MVIKLEDDDYIRFLNDQNVHDDQVMDPVYKVFLEHLREDGKSYVFEMVDVDNGTTAIVKYEGDDDASRRNKEDTQARSGDISRQGRDNYESKRKQSRKFRSVSDEGVKFFPPPSKQSELPLIDESYGKFLSHLKLTENSMILELDSVSLTYEEERETSTSSGILPSEDNVKENVNSNEQGLVPCGTTEPSDITVYKDGNSLMVSLDRDCYEFTDFKTKLVTVLSKQYDQAEYEKLLEAATERKPLNKQKHLRSMSISYATKKVGQSYLDHFPDLAEQIWSADADSDRRLNLLRGFFFWLKNLSHEGAYMPWMSSGYEVIAADDCEVVPPMDIARD